MSGPLVADTGGLLWALARDESGAAAHTEYESELLEANRVIVPGLVLAEVDYFLRRQRTAMRQLLADIFDPASRYEYEAPTPQDLARAAVFDRKFAGLQLGLVDGTVAAVAERRGVYRVFTTDRRDFGAIRVGARFDRVLELVP